MRKSIIFTLLLTIAAQGAWAEEYNYYPVLMTPTPSDGVWTFDAVNNHVERTGKGDRYFSFNQLDHTSWSKRSHDGHAIIYQFKDGDGLGFTMCCNQADNGIFGVYSTYYHDEILPPYTRKKLTWKYTLRGKVEDFFEQQLVLYALQDLDELKNLVVDFYVDALRDEPSRIASYNIWDEDWGTSHTEESKKKDTTFDFDNRNGNDTTIQSWYLMLTQVMGAAAGGDGIHEWGSFDTKSYTWTTYYYKHLRFDVNGGTGTMINQEIENSAALPANTFTREGYTFAGWATALDGDVAYADGAEITATESDKGPVTLYAVWAPTPATVKAAISAIGTVAYTGQCKALIDAARALYDAMRDEDKASVDNYSTLTAAEVLYADVDAVVTAINAIYPLTYPDSQTAIELARDAYNALTNEQKALVPNAGLLTAAQEMYAVLETIAKIEAIGTVVYTEQSKALIDAARDTYDALTDGQKTQVTNYAKLLDAEDAYAAFGKSTVLFVDKDEDPVGSPQQKQLYYPELPDGATQWQTVEKDASDKTIVIKAVK